MRSEVIPVLVAEVLVADRNLDKAKIDVQVVAFNS
jgi:hypothetical protein